MLKYFAFISFVALLHACVNHTAETVVSGAQSNLQNTNVEFKVIKIGDKENYGFEIFENRKAIIHQEIIPSIAGMNNFKSGEDAKKVACLMVQKIKNGIFPPSVTSREIDSLKINTSL